jgi:hypothetical protein
VIEVPCYCGKTYRVPASKAGKKLHCRRCGSIQRIPRYVKTDSDEPIVVPFQMPGVDDDLFGGEGIRAPDAPPLELKRPVRRCPSCGAQDDATVVVCVRCGFDWRTGKRVEDAFEHEVEASARERTHSAEAEVERLISLGWLALTPLGVVLGPWVASQTLGLQRRLLDVRGPRDAAQRLAQVRVTALSGALLWALLILGGLWAIRGRAGPNQAEESASCRARLVQVGEELRARSRAAPFPREGAFGDALDSLGAAGQPLEGKLHCPLQGGLYPYGRRSTAPLTAATSPDFIVLWDEESHADPQGRLRFRALRADGTVETFPSLAALNRGKSRPQFVVSEPIAPPAGEGTDEVDEPTSGGEAPVGGGGEGQPGALAEAFRAFAEECQEDDPEVLLRLPPDEFHSRLGVPAETLLPAMLEHADEELRGLAALMLARLELPAALTRRLARRGTQADGPRERLGAGLALQRVGDKDWLPVVASVAEDGAPVEVRVAHRVIAEGVAKDPGLVARALHEAADMRERLGAEGDDALFTFPAEVLPAVALQLGDQTVRREASAVLYSADEAGVQVLLETLRGAAGRAVRTGCFETLDRLRTKGVLTLSAFLEAVEAEPQEALRGLAIAPLSRAKGAPEQELVRWCLKTLRREPSASGLREACQRVLARTGRLPSPASTEAEHLEGLGWLLEDLTQVGDHKPLLGELAASYRRGDGELDRLLRQRLDDVKSWELRFALMKFAEKRHPREALAVLIEGTSDRQPDVRVAALEGLRRSPAPRSPEVRRKVARLVAERLRSEEDPRTRAELFRVASSPGYCAKPGLEGVHECNSALLRSLKGLCKDGDVGALRCLAEHPNPDNLGFLVRLLAENESDQAFLANVASALQVLSGCGATSLRADKWRIELEKEAAGIERRLTRRAAKEWRAIESARETAEARLKKLRGD